MRLWVEVYDGSDTLLGLIVTATGASTVTALDGAGNFSFNVPAADYDGIALLQNERKVRLFVEMDDAQRELSRGIIQSIKVSASEGQTLFTVSGPDDMDMIARRSCLLGRSYSNQTLQAITNDLIGLVTGWSATVETNYASTLQSARFEGSNVLKALIRMAQEKSLHLRAGDTANALDIGTFGTDSGIWAVAPETISIDLYNNDGIVLIESISQTTDSRDVINWIIPIGGGEGTAALTLKDSTRSISGGYPYDIGSMTGPDGRTLYYLADADSIATYGQIEKIVTFKEIGPVANSSTAKTLAANALYDAAAAWLQRNSVPLVTYSMAVRKIKQNIKPGDKIRVTYKGYIPTAKGDVVPISLDYQQFWVMKKNERIGVEGLSASLDIASVDRVEMDTARVVVGALEAISVRNVAIQTYPFCYQDGSERVIQGAENSSDKDAEWTLQIPNLMTEVILARFQFITRPPYALTDENWNLTLPGTPNKYYYVSNGQLVTALYPSKLKLFINEVDVTADVDPSSTWNQGGENAALNVTVDITDYILGATGGIFQTHKIRIKAGLYAALYDHKVNTSYGASQSYISIGVIEGKFLVFGTAQNILPS